MSDNKGLLVWGKDLAYRLPTGRVLFDNLTVELNTDELMLVTGPNGSGKSTLIKLILGEVRPTKGKIQLAPKAKHISYLPQLQNIEFHLPMTLHQVANTLLTDNIPAEKLSELNLLTKEQLEHTWNGASGGERQRTLLTAALLSKPEILILDEPFNHLDQPSQTLMVQALKTYLTDSTLRMKSVILVSHASESAVKALGVNVKRVSLGEAGA